MNTKLEHPKLSASVPESLEEQELLELAQELDVRRKQEKKSLWQRLFPKDLLTIFLFF